MNRAKFCFMLFASLILFVTQAGVAGPLRDRILERRAEPMDEEETAGDPGLPTEGVRSMKDISYGDDSRQKIDVYAPRNAIGSPVIFMVHGGAWKIGDKTSRAVVKNKVDRWVPRGFIFISVNYRLLPAADPLKQAEDVARALAFAQSRARSWGGDPAKFILMGHSSGAHLVSLLAVSPSKALNIGAKPWLGAILLDSAAFNVVQIMKTAHFRFYDTAFGAQEAYWQSASPFYVLSSPTAPILAVCSSRRDDSCLQAKAFTAKANSMGSQVKVLEQNMSHREINESLGTALEYTAAVEDFMASLDPLVKRTLLNAPAGTGRH
jgi:acetyl esterase/lipase